MDFSDFSNDCPWLIVPERLEGLLRGIDAHVRAHGIPGSTAATISAALPVPPPYAVKDGVAIINVSGPLTKRLGFWSFLFGGASYESIAAAYKTAVEDQSVSGIMLRIDSPGGTLNGLDEAADVIFKSRGAKPSVAFADGMMASAAYWLGSAVDHVVAQRTSEVGSIGVLVVHADWSGWNKQNGINVTYMTAGRYKALGNPDEPLSDLARKEIQGKLDYFYNIFTGTVAQHRGVDDKEVQSKMAEGRVFIGDQAQAVGLVDDVGDFQAAMDYLKSRAGGAGRASHISSQNSQIETECQTTTTEATEVDEAMDFKTLSIELLSKERPDLVTSIESVHVMRIAKLEDDVKAKDATIAEQNKKILEADKREALRAEKELLAAADGIWTKHLAAVPERLHSRIRKHVSHEEFVKDGVLDKDGFAKAVKDEVAFWAKETGAPAEEVLGSTYVTRTVAGTDEEKEDDAAVAAMLAMVEQK